MNSPHQREQLPDLLSDALESTERARVESHLEQCEQCARELRALEQMQQTVASLPAATPPDRVRANVRAALREDKKRVWTPLAMLANRAKDDARSRPIKDSERIGARKALPLALPFALPARQLAWGGAVALGAVGLMLLARPSLQNDSLSPSASVGEAELATRADSGAADASIAGATANSATANAMQDATGNSAPTKTASVPTKNANAKAQPDAKSAPARATGDAASGAWPTPSSNGALPPLPPPPSRTRVTPPEAMAPLPRIQTPPFELFPNVVPTPERKSDDSKPLKRPSAPTSPKQPVPSTKTPSARVAAPKPAPQKSDNQSEASPAQAPAPPSILDAAKANSSASTSSADSSEASNAGGFRAQLDRSNNAPSAFTPAGPPAAATRAAPAPLARQKPIASKNWTGGEVEATINVPRLSAGRARLAETDQTPILTLGVDKAIGDARLFLLLPSGETQVWRGSMNAAPVTIKLPNLAAQLRSGQKIRARLEQIDGEGNPKGSTTFSLLWP